MEPRTDVKIQQLRHFVLVARYESFRVAAEKAFRTQPAVSLSIRELESRLGSPLFEKGGKVALTDFGRACYPLASALLEHHEATVESMQAIAQARHGRVSIGSVPSYARSRMPELVRRFSTAHPGIRVDLRDDNARHVQAMVLARQVDFGVASLWEMDRAMDFEPLERDPIGLVCRRDHALARCGGPLPWRRLAEHARISNGTCRLLEGTKAAESMADCQFAVSNTTSLLAMLEADLGITTLPRLALPPERRDLVFIKLTDPVVERELGILTLRGRALSPAAEALVRMLRAQSEIERESIALPRSL